jgi:hypothetical protein
MAMSFPRKRESTSPPTIPVCAGMTDKAYSAKKEEGNIQFDFAPEVQNLGFGFFKNRRSTIATT